MCVRKQGQNNINLKYDISLFLIGLHDKLIAKTHQISLFDVHAWPGVIKNRLPLKKIIVTDKTKLLCTNTNLTDSLY